MGHSLGISDSYFRPSEAEMLDEYLRAVPHLTIGGGSEWQSAELDTLKQHDGLANDSIASLADEVMRLRTELSELKAMER